MWHIGVLGKLIYIRVVEASSLWVKFENYIKMISICNLFNFISFMK